MDQCCVDGCSASRKTHPTMPFHLFPRENQCTVTVTNKLGLEVNMDRRLAWEYFLLRDSPATSNCRVCARHFIPDDYLWKGDCYGEIAKQGARLRPVSVPSLNLPGDEFLQKDFIERFHSDMQCRICRTHSFKVRSLFDLEPFTRKFYRIDKAITTCASVQVEKGDGLPQYACLQCIELLHTAVRFKQLCESSDGALRARLSEKRSCRLRALLTEKLAVDGPVFTIETLEGASKKPNVERTLNLNFAKRVEDDDDDIDVFDAEIYKEAHEEILDLLDAPEDSRESDDDNDNATPSCYKSESLGVLCTEEHNYARLCPPSDVELELLSLLSRENFKIENEELDIKSETSSNHSLDQMEENEIQVDEINERDELQIGEIHDIDELQIDEIHERDEIQIEEIDERDEIQEDIKEEIEIEEEVIQIDSLETQCTEDPLGIVKIRKSFDSRKRSRPLWCGICGYTSYNSSTFQKHQVLHYSDKKPQKCKICSKSFPDKAFLDLHARTHTKFGVLDAENLCDLCNVHFKSRSDLLTHKRNHYRSRLAQLGVVEANRRVSNVQKEKEDELEEKMEIESVDIDS